MSHDTTFDKQDVRFDRPVRVIKRQDCEKSAADYQRDHEIALLKLLAKKHPDIAADLATTTAK